MKRFATLCLLLFAFVATGAIPANIQRNSFTTNSPNITTQVVNGIVATWTGVKWQPSSANLTNWSLLSTNDMANKTFVASSITTSNASMATSNNLYIASNSLQAQIVEGVAGVSTWNGRAGAVTLESADVTTTLGYTPATNSGQGIRAALNWNGHSISNVNLALGTGIVANANLAVPLQRVATNDGSALTNLPNGNAFSPMAYGAVGTNTTTTVSSWSSALLVNVASGTSFRAGQWIGIDRAGAAETTGDVSGQTITAVDASGFSIGNQIRVIGGRAAQALKRSLTIRVAGNTGDIHATRVNGTRYAYTVAGGDTAANVATNLAAAIAASGVTAMASNTVVYLTANVAGTEFTYENVRPTGRGKVSYDTVTANIPVTDYITTITNKVGNTLTVSPAVPSIVTGVRIEKAQNRLLTVITNVVGNALSLSNAATTQATSVTVYHDDQPAFLAAATAARSAGGYVSIPSGTYTLATQSELNMTNVSFVGAGQDATIIRAPQPIDTGHSSKLMFNEAGGATNLLIQGFTLDLLESAYAASGLSGISVGDYRNAGESVGVRVNRVTVKNGASSGLNIFNASDVWVSQCGFRDLGYNGVQVGLYDSGAVGDKLAKNIWVTDNVFDRIAWIGVLTYGEGAGNTYALGRFTDVHVNGNTFRNCKLCGAEFYTGVQNGEIVGNTAQYCGGAASIWTPGSTHAAISVKRSQNVTVVGNSVMNSHYGLECLGLTPDVPNGFNATRDVKFAGNLVTDCYIGINLAYESDNVSVLNNEVAFCANAGVTASASDSAYSPVRRLRIAENTVRDCRYGVLLSKGVKDAEILRNTFDSNNGYETSDDENAAISMNPYAAGTYPLTNIVVSWNRIIESRTGAAYKQYSVYANNVTNLSFYANYASGNETNGPVVENSPAVLASVQNSWDSRGYLEQSYRDTNASSVRVGVGATAGMQGVALGDGAVASANSVIAGFNAGDTGGANAGYGYGVGILAANSAAFGAAAIVDTGSYQSVAFGNAANVAANAPGGIAIGRGAEVLTEHTNSIAIGRAAATDEKEQIKLGNGQKVTITGNLEANGTSNNVTGILNVGTLTATNFNSPAGVNSILELRTAGGLKTFTSYGSNATTTASNLIVSADATVSNVFQLSKGLRIDGPSSQPFVITNDGDSLHIQGETLGDVFTASWSESGQTVTIPVAAVFGSSVTGNLGSGTNLNATELRSGTVAIGRLGTNTPQDTYVATVTNSGTQIVWAPAAASAVSFDTITAGTSTDQAFFIGNGSALDPTGSGTITATDMSNLTAPTNAQAADLVLTATSDGTTAWKAASGGGGTNAETTVLSFTDDTNVLINLTTPVGVSTNSPRSFFLTLTTNAMIYFTGTYRSGQDVLIWFQQDVTGSRRVWLTNTCIGGTTVTLPADKELTISTTPWYRSAIKMNYFAWSNQWQVVAGPANGYF